MSKPSFTYNPGLLSLPAADLTPPSSGVASLSLTPLDSATSLEMATILAYPRRPIGALPLGVTASPMFPMPGMPCPPPPAGPLAGAGVAMPAVTGLAAGSRLTPAFSSRGSDASNYHGWPTAAPAKRPRSAAAEGDAQGALATATSPLRKRSRVEDRLASVEGGLESLQRVVKAQTAESGQLRQEAAKRDAAVVALQNKVTGLETHLQLTQRLLGEATRRLEDRPPADALPEAAVDCIALQVAAHLEKACHVYRLVNRGSEAPLGEVLFALESALYAERLQRPAAPPK